MDDLDVTGYAARVQTVVVKMLLLIAVLLMPLGMAPAAASTHGGHAGAAMPMQHCPDQGSDHRSKAAFAECTMACASALPAVDRMQEQPIPYETIFVTAGPLLVLHGHHPETGTPPPRTA